MSETSPSLAEALAAASDTNLLVMRSGALEEIGSAFRSEFANASAVVVADPTTFNVAGERVLAMLQQAGISTMQPILLSSPDLHAEWKHIEHLDAVLANTEATPIAVGSGTINDLTKLAAHRAGRLYMAVPTAASMDGYTAYGASVIKDGSKQTFSCPAPRAVVADLDIVATAPREMTAAGYADLMAKVTAGADWLVSDALGIEPLDAFSWQLVQQPLQLWLSDPEQISAGEPEALGRLLEGLMMGGFAMQHLQSSRPASGAEHQFSHLWDMQHHTHEGSAPSHGFKVGIGTIASAALYEAVFENNLQELDIEKLVAAYPSLEDDEVQIRALLGTSDLARKALEETEGKRFTSSQLRKVLQRLKDGWPKLADALRSQLLSSKEIARRLEIVGAPARSEQIGISSERLKLSFLQAYYIRRRFTVLDLALITGLLKPAVERAVRSLNPDQRK